MTIVVLNAPSLAWETRSAHRQAAEADRQLSVCVAQFSAIPVRTGI